jgi:hypothetical protein|tara:strand:+ start:1060 stop:1689 length:630 start_codon:yes stop_codon:yes gene_type:complete
MKSNLNIDMQGHVKIFDVDTGEILVDKANKIHAENMSRCIATTLSNKDNFSLYEMHFGNDGTIIDAQGNVTYREPKVTFANDDLYNDRFFKNFDILDADNTDTSANKMDVVYTDGNAFTDIIITCTLNYDEPLSSDTNFNLATDNQTSTDGAGSGQFIFDELGLKSKSSTGRNTGLLLSHVVFHPVEKSANRKIQVLYTIKVRTNYTAS